MGVVGRFGAAISGTRGIRRGSCRGRVRLGAFLMLRDTPAATIWGEMRVALAQGSFTSLHARGRQIPIAGILLLIPGFITDIAALCLLIPPYCYTCR